MSEPTEPEVITAQTIKCVDTEEGYKLVATECQCGGRKGMTACAIAPNRAILFGGVMAGNNSYPSDLWQVTDGEEGSELSWHKLETDGESPAGRAFHTAAIFGEQGRHMAVCGGYDGKKVLDELWVLDFSILLATEVEAAKHKAKGKGGAMPRWHRIESSIKLPVARFMHCSFSKASSLFIFGGISETGLLDTTVHEITLAESIHDDTYKFSEVKIFAEPVLMNTVQSAAAAVVPDTEPGDRHITKPVLLFLFGGATQDSHSSVLFLDDEHAVSKRVHRRLKELYPDAPIVEEPVVITHKEYPNGDVYDGELVDNYEIRHGRGTIRYAVDGSVYEVRGHASGHQYLL